jgi:CDP-diacylglycerol--glycerol-3-phosphate 3-phosphatidyltransferase
MMAFGPIGLGPLWVLCAGLVAVLAAYSARVLLLGRATDPRVQKERATPLLGTFPMEAMHWALRGAGRKIAALGVSPDAVTWTSLALTVSTVPLAATGHFDWAALMLALGSACDALDGIVARYQHVASDSGEVFDAVVDRYADAMPLVGLSIYYRDSVVALAVMLGAIVGSALVSYVRAKAEAMQLSLPGGLMRRHERLVYVGIALAIGPYLTVPHLPFARPATVTLVALVAVVSNIAAALLTRDARLLLAHSGRGPRSAGKGK